MRDVTLAFVIGAVLSMVFAVPSLYHADKEIQHLVLENKGLSRELDRAYAELHSVCGTLTIDHIDNFDLTECAQ